MRQLKSLSDLGGKTIARVAEIDDNLAILVCDDGSFLRLHAVVRWEDACIECDSEPQSHELKAAGLMTAEEYTAAQAAKELNHRQWTEQRDREEYARLRAKYEGKAVVERGE